MATAYQDGWDKKYCYPETNILKNRLNIKDELGLYNAERDIVANRATKLKEEPTKGRFDLGHLQKIHKELFGEIYDWAGKLRTINIAKGNLFCAPEHIPNMAAEIFEKL